jgi:hypothetical protein
LDIYDASGCKHGAELRRTNSDRLNQQDITIFSRQKGRVSVKTIYFSRSWSSWMPLLRLTRTGGRCRLTPYHRSQIVSMITISATCKTLTLPKCQSENRIPVPSTDIRYCPAKPVHTVSYRQAINRNGYQETPLKYQNQTKQKIRQENPSPQNTPYLTSPSPLAPETQVPGGRGY